MFSSVDMFIFSLERQTLTSASVPRPTPSGNLKFIDHAHCECAAWGIVELTRRHRHSVCYDRSLCYCVRVRLSFSPSCSRFCSYTRSHSRPRSRLSGTQFDSDSRPRVRSATNALCSCSCSCSTASTCGIKTGHIKFTEYELESSIRPSARTQPEERRIER